MSNATPTSSLKSPKQSSETRKIIKRKNDKCTEVLDIIGKRLSCPKEVQQPLDEFTLIGNILFEASQGKLNQMCTLNIATMNDPQEMQSNYNNYMISS